LEQKHVEINSLTSSFKVTTWWITVFVPCT